jgi:adenine-specific DNA-methyltransferase
LISPYLSKYYAFELTKRCPSDSIEKLAGQKQIKALESTRNTKRRSLFEAQDEIDAHREKLISSIEEKLKQKTSMAEVFKIRWRLT